MPLKIAAVVALAASLVYLTLRKPHRPEIITAASAPPSESARDATPRIVAADQLSKDGVLVSPQQGKSDSDQESALDRSSPMATTTAPTDPAGKTAESSLAMERTQESDKPSEPAASGRASGTFSKREAAPSPARLDVVTSAPGAAGPNTLAASRPAKPPSPEQRMTRSFVRIRAATGTFFGGVLVSSDGLILAFASLPADSLRQPCTIFLDDQGERSAVARAVPMGPGWYCFLVDAKNLPTATLARESPANDASLAFAVVDPLSGVMTLAHVPAGNADSSRRAVLAPLEKSSRSVGNASFAFNVAGELLVIDQAAQESQTATLAKTRTDRSNSKAPLVRPFTEAERTMLQRAARRKEKE